MPPIPKRVVTTFFALIATGGILAPLSFAAQPNPKAKSAPKKAPAPAAPAHPPGEDAASINKKREARRVQLAAEIARYQAIMDRFDKQNSFKPARDGLPVVTREEYEAAKAARDKAQQERDDLSR